MPLQKTGPNSVSQGKLNHSLHAVKENVTKPYVFIGKLKYIPKLSKVQESNSQRKDTWTMP